MKKHRSNRCKWVAFVGCLLLASCASSRVVRTERGIASWYCRATNSPRGTGVTASGIPLHDHSATAAHKKLPFGTRVRFINLRTGQSEVVVITDRGPYVRGRVIDVTAGVAKRTGFYGSGITPCKLEILGNDRLETLR